MPAVDVLPTTNKVITDAVLSEKLTVPKLVKNLPEFFATPRFITVLSQPVICPYPEPDQSSPRSYPTC